MSDVYLVLLALWLMWVAFNVSVMLLGALLLKPKYPAFNGFRVIVPEDCVARLSETELNAVIQHELGHKRHWHVWKNLARVCFFCRASYTVRIGQELQADDCATNPAAMASALLKISQHPLDVLRAHRLIKKGQQEAGDPTSGMDAPTLGRST